MRINNKILSIPPYISTSWRNIASLYQAVKDSKNVLVIVLTQGSTIEVPNLEQPMIDAIFSAHSKFSEAEQTPSPMSRAPQRGPLPQNSPAVPVDPMNLTQQLRIGIGGLESIGSLLQHNPEQADSPNLPKEVLNKITTLSKAMGIDDPSAFPKGEPHCNCMHCQIAKALHGQIPEETPAQIEEEVTAEDLKFRLWDIDQTGDKLYVVTNPLDGREYYNVYLGEPIGCTCGARNCEHIRAVLNS